MKKLHRTQGTGWDDWAFVVCESCGWTGFDAHDLIVDPDVTPCPSCGGLYAVYALDY